MKKIKLALSFSGGKDAMMALYHLKHSATYEVCCLLTTISHPYRRVVMQGVRDELIEAQASALRLPLIKVLVNLPTMEAYELEMARALLALKQQGISHIAYGDIFLSSLKDYRDKQLAKVGLSGIYPIWGTNSLKLIETFWLTGGRAIVCSAQDTFFDKNDVGKAFDTDFVNALPEGVDPAGENGEFHTFVTEGSLFDSPIPITLGEIVYSTCPSDDALKPEASVPGCWYADLLHAGR